MIGQYKIEQVFMQKQPSKRFFKKSEIWENSQEVFCAGISFSIKLNSVTWNFIKNESLAQLFSCEFCEICKNVFFAEHHWTTASNYTSINSSEGRIGKRNCKS